MISDSRAGSPQPQLTISVVSHGNAEEVRHLLAGLLQYEDTRRIQMLVTDNLGGDLPELDAVGWESLRILRNRRPQGLASNHNAAFPHVNAPYFCVLNPDVVPVQKIIPSLLQRLESGQAHVVAPLVVDSQGVLQDTFRNLPNPLELVQRRLVRERAAPELPLAQDTISPEWIAGVFLLMKREVFAALGGLDERYRLYFEDVDFCTRARLAGYSLLVDRHLLIRHDANRTSHRDSRYLLWHLQSAFRFFTSPVYRLARQRSAKTG